MNYKVRFSPSDNYKIFKSSGAQTLDELKDVQLSGQNNDKYILIYDASIQKWVDVNPDELLLAAATRETTQPGLPEEFLNELEIDAGGF